MCYKKGILLDENLCNISQEQKARQHKLIVYPYWKVNHFPLGVVVKSVGGENISMPGKQIKGMSQNGISYCTFHIIDKNIFTAVNHSFNLHRDFKM